jgi:uncharacterized protein
MLIDIDRLADKELRINQDYEFISSDLVDENAVFLDPVHADLVVKKIGDEIFIKGKITALISFVCSRCLSPYEFPIDSNFDLVYLPEELEEMKDQLEAEDMHKFFYSSPALDLATVVLEQINFTFPLKPLCMQDCQGICPVCGKIVKDGECSCAIHESDSRLDKFKIFMKDKR